MHLRALKVADATCERTARSKCCHGHDFIYNLILIQWHLEAKTHAIYSHFGWIWLVLLDHYAVIIDCGFVCVWERRVFRTIFHGKCFEVRRMENQCDAAGNREGRHRWRWSYVVLEKAWRQHSPLEHNLFAWTISTCFCLTIAPRGRLSTTKCKQNTHPLYPKHRSGLLVLDLLRIAPKIKFLDPKIQQSAQSGKHKNLKIDSVILRSHPLHAAIYT